MQRLQSPDPPGTRSRNTTSEPLRESELQKEKKKGKKDKEKKKGKGSEDGQTNDLEKSVIDEFGSSVLLFFFFFDCPELKCVLFHRFLTEFGFSNQSGYKSVL